MFIRKLECLNKSQGFINISANRKIIDSDLPQGAVAVDDEETPEGKPLVLLENTISPAYGHTLVCQQRDLHLSQSTSLATLLAPGQVEKWESVEQAMTAQFRASNSATLSENAMISVGQTKVKSRGLKKRTTYLPL